MEKKIRRLFSLADYLEEEQFLQEQHRAGWKMVDFKLLGSNYIFEKCEPEEYIYQLDFKEPEQSDEEYLQLFEDCGWEYFHQYGRWYYFRKKKSEIEEENNIFNDAPSRAEMAKKVLQMQWLALLPVLIVLPTLIKLFSSGSLGIIGLIFFSLYVCIAIFLIGLGIRNYWKLNTIIEKNTLL